jgi:hypothetical protein
MKHITTRSLTSLAFGIALLLTACSTPPHYRAPTYAEITPGPHKEVADLSTTIEVPPFPYSTPLPPPAPSSLDGLYSKLIPLEGTPTPCKRCAGYRLEGGLWTLYLDKGIYKVFQQDTDFEAVGSFVVSGNQITFFNDPYCEEDMRMVGTYTWEWDARNELRLSVVADPCSIGLRAKNLTSTPWVKTPLLPQDRASSCQPPNREAGITDHWKKPPYCG